MKIILNGDPFDTPGPVSVDDLLIHLKIDPRRVAVEHNLLVIKRAVYAATIVQEGDTIEIVNFVGGGEGVEPFDALGIRACSGQALRRAASPVRPELVEG